jgi:hypothetical protein
MLLELFQRLSEVNPDFSVFAYITLRGILSALTALAISLLLGPSFIRRLVKGQVGQPIRELGPKSHFAKAGTPTMGGALILFAIVLSTLLWSDLNNRYVWVVLLVTLAFGLIGFVDDYNCSLEIPGSVSCWSCCRNLSLLECRIASRDRVNRTFLQGHRYTPRNRLHPGHLFLYCRVFKCCKPDRRTGRPGDYARRIYCRCSRHFCLRHRAYRVF